MKKIVIIDDEPGFRDRVEMILQTKGYETTTAANGKDGIRISLCEPPDLIICDLNMDDSDGYVVLAELRKNPVTAAIPFILMTGSLESPEAMRRGMNLGADDFLKKPFTPDALISAVDARLKKQEILRDHEERTKGRLVAILEATTDLVAIVDAQTYNFLYLNQAGRLLLDLGEGEDVNQLCIENFHPARIVEMLKRDALPRAVRDGFWTGETSFARRNGNEITVSQVILAHKDVNGAVDYFSTIARDITEQRRLEKERSLMEVQLRQALKLESIGQLAAGIAHEINTPTQYIGDNTRFLKESFRDLAEVFKLLEQLNEADKSHAVGDDWLRQLRVAVARADLAYLSAEIPKAVEQALEGVTRVAKIVCAMKEFSHPGSTEKTQINLNQAVESTITVCRNEWKYVADLVTEFDESLLPVTCLPGELNQTILNLIVNASHTIADVVGDGSKGKGQITVTTKQDGDWAEIRIRDTGTGIPESARAKVFDPFFTTKGVGKGTGQGLAIARSVVVDKHAGTIHFETETGKGTTFIIRLPTSSNPTSMNRRAA